MGETDCILSEDSVLPSERKVSNTCVSFLGRLHKTTLGDQSIYKSLQVLLFCNIIAYVGVNCDKQHCDSVRIYQEPYSSVLILVVQLLNIGEIYVHHLRKHVITSFVPTHILYCII